MRDQIKWETSPEIPLSPGEMVTLLTMFSLQKYLIIRDQFLEDNADVLEVLRILTSYQKRR